MEYKEFFARLKEGTLPRCILMHGEEEYIKRSALEQLRKAVLPAGLEMMNEALFEGNAEENAIIEALEMLPMMGDVRLVVVKEHPLVSSGKGTGDGTALVKYIQDMPPHAMLVFYLRANADTRKRVTSAIVKAGGAALFRPVDDQDLFAFLRRECQRCGKAAPREALERLVLLCGRDLTTLVPELEKICAFAGEREEIAPQDVEAVAIPNLEANVFQMVEGLMDGSAAKAMGIQRRLLKDGESAIMILAVLARNLRQLYHARLMLSQKVPRAQVEKGIGLSGFVAGKVIARAERLNASFLGDMLLACTQADYQIKSGVLREDMALEGVVLRMAMCYNSTKTMGAGGRA